jgi:hypothetical protein
LVQLGLADFSLISVSSVDEYKNLNAKDILLRVLFSKKVIAEHVRKGILESQM